MKWPAQRCRCLSRHFDLMVIQGCQTMQTIENDEEPWGFSTCTKKCHANSSPNITIPTASIHRSLGYPHWRIAFDHSVLSPKFRRSTDCICAGCFAPEMFIIKSLNRSLSLSLYAHVHTHTYIYNYIYIYACYNPFLLILTPQIINTSGSFWY